MNKGGKNTIHIHYSNDHFINKNSIALAMRKKNKNTENSINISLPRS